MKNKEGFTLVELLAVIAILVILVIIALPNVLKLFNEAKKNTFLTEVRTVYKEATKKYINESVKGNTIRNISSEGSNQLDISGEQLNYCITLNSQGKVLSMKVGNGEYYIEYTGSSINDITINDIHEGDTDFSSCIVDEPVEEEPDDEPVDITNLSLNFNLTVENFGRPYQITYSINNASSSNLTKVKYEIYRGNTLIETTIKTNKSDNFSGTHNGDEYMYDFTVKAYDQHDNLMFQRTYNYCFVAGTKVKTENGYKNIEDIKVGDKVYSYNFDNNSLELKRVNGTIKSSAFETLKFYFDNDTFEVSLRHRIYVVDKGWTEAKDIVVGDILLDDNYNPVKINKIDKIQYNTPIDTYNLSVDGNSNYFVTNIRILVHNSPV